MSSGDDNDMVGVVGIGVIVTWSSSLQIMSSADGRWTDHFYM